MAKLISPAIASLDGYIADESGSFDWAEPDDTVEKRTGSVPSSSTR